MQALTRSKGASAALAGMILGVGAFCVAEVLVPQSESSTQHDIRLAGRLGYIYAGSVAVWCAWLQASWSLAVRGLIVSAVVGALYGWLSSGGNFFAIMVAFPCLLGGAMAAALPSEFSRPVRGLAGRFFKGLLAGFVLGFVYMFVLNSVGSLIARPSEVRGVEAYVKLMWFTGPVALGTASALFFPLFRWAIGLTRIVVDHRDVRVETPPN